MLTVCVAGVRVGDSMLFAITHDNLKLTARLLDYAEKESGRKGSINVTSTAASAGNGDGGVGGRGRYGDGDDDSDEFPAFMTPLMLAAQCGRYETVEYLLSRGYVVKKPHPPRCACDEWCSAKAVANRTFDVVAEGCERLNAYRAISDPTYVCCTSANDPILTCFQLHDELLECGNVNKVYNTVYCSIAQKVF